jgi:outer membrane scaffolding protein for murein synthesis (MipA/OmpV family)
MKTLTLLLTLAVAGFVASPGAQAQSGGGPPAKAWAVTVGAAPLIGPAFPGSDDYALSVFPDLRLNYKDKFFLSIPDGVGYNVVNTKTWRAGPLVKLRFGRDESGGGNPFIVVGDSDDLQGLGDVGAAGEAGGFLEYRGRRYGTRMELRQGFGAHDGWVADIGASVRGFRKVPWLGPSFWSYGPRATFGSGDFVDPYFGIDAGQSAASGLPEYSAGSGIVSAGFGGALVHPVNQRLAVTFFANYDRFLGDTADSPLITERGTENVFVLGMAVGYVFPFGGK